MEPKKKVKHQTSSKSGISLRNYPKLTEKRTHECVSELLAYSLDNERVNLSNWISLGNPPNSEQFAFLIVDEISGRDLEDMLVSASPKIRAFFADKTKFARMSNKSIQRDSEDYFFGIWNELLVKNKHYLKFHETKASNEITDNGTSENGEQEADKNDDQSHKENNESKQTNEPLSDTKQDQSQQRSYHEVAYQSFCRHMLNESQLRENLFPNQHTNSDYWNSELSSFTEANILSIDCEMVETKKGIELARITIVDIDFEPVYDVLVRPQNEVVNYNTHITGLTANSFNSHKWVTLEKMHEEIQMFVGKNSILVGHSLENDLHAMRLIHTKVVDTSVLFPKDNGYKYSLKNLAYNYFRAKIQQGSHDSIEDAQIALALAKLKVDILSRLNSSIFQDKSANLDFLKELCRHKKVMVLDFDFNIKPLLPAGIFIDKITHANDVLDKLEACMTVPSDDTGFFSIVFGHYLMHKNHEFEQKSKRLVEFVEHLIDWKAASPGRLFCLATVSYNKKTDPSVAFGYDMFFVA